MASASFPDFSLPPASSPNIRLMPELSPLSLSLSFLREGERTRGMVNLHLSATRDRFTDHYGDENVAEIE